MNTDQNIQQLERNISTNNQRIEHLKNEVEMLEVQTEALVKLKEKKEKEAK